MGFEGSPSHTFTSLATAVDVVERALDEALSFPAHVASDLELCDFLIRSPRLRAKFDALMASVATAADRAGAAAVLELRKTDQVVGAQTGADPAVTRADLRIGAWVSDFPQLEAAWRAGTLNREHLDFIRKGLDSDRTHATLVGDQHFFVDQAAKLSFRDFTTAALYWLHMVDPDGEAPKEQVAKTHLRVVRRPDGTVSLNGIFDPLSGQVVWAAVEQEAQSS